VPSSRPYQGLPALDYPFHDKTVTVTSCGRICFNRRKINLSTVFAGQSVGIKQVSDHIWLVSFMDYDLGYFDHETCRLEPIQNPFGPKVLRPLETSAPGLMLEKLPSTACVGDDGVARRYADFDQAARAVRGA